MKQAFLCFFMIILLVGCSPRQGESAPLTQQMKETLQKDLRLSLIITENGRSQSALLLREGETMQLQFFSPEEINGLTAQIDSEGLSLSFLGLNAEKTSLPREGALSFLWEILEALTENELSYRLTDAGALVETPMGSALLDRNTGQLLLLENSDQTISIQITGQ